MLIQRVTEAAWPSDTSPKPSHRPTSDVKVFSIFLVTKIQPTPYVFFVPLSCPSPHDLQPKTAILPQEPLPQFHFQFGPSARGKLFSKIAGKHAQVQVAAKAAKFFLRAASVRAEA